MSSPSVVRAKCYLILEGLERSLAENLIRNFDIDLPGFLTKEEQERALYRLREDMQQSEWGLEDVTAEDLLIYLDLGDLRNLLNRHKSSVRNATQSDVESAAKIIEDRDLYSIRKRVMHPVRPLEADDLPTLMSIATKLPKSAPSLIWGLLAESVSLAQDPERFLNVTIPSFWAEDSAILHNLPAAEFDDTGFIGRKKEGGQVGRLLQSDHNVITVVGAGGIGKTALALRVCHDILDNQASNLDRIVWVSLKTHYLTADGIRQISDAVETPSTLVDYVMSEIAPNIDVKQKPGWDRVLEQMKASRLLLVIDNLETLGSEIRDLAVGIPRGSRLLLTSRIGLGEIELRFEILSLSPQDAKRLLIGLVVAYNYQSAIRPDGQSVARYCKRLHYNPYSLSGSFKL